MRLHCVRVAFALRLPLATRRIAYCIAFALRLVFSSGFAFALLRLRCCVFQQLLRSIALPVPHFAFAFAFALLRLRLRAAKAAGPPAGGSRGVVAPQVMPSKVIMMMIIISVEIKQSFS